VIAATEIAVATVAATHTDRVEAAVSARSNATNAEKEAITQEIVEIDVAQVATEWTATETAVAADDTEAETDVIDIREATQEREVILDDAATRLDHAVTPSREVHEATPTIRYVPKTVDRLATTRIIAAQSQDQDRQATTGIAIVTLK